MPDPGALNMVDRKVVGEPPAHAPRALLSSKLTLTHPCTSSSATAGLHHRPAGGQAHIRDGRHERLVGEGHPKVGIRTLGSVQRQAKKACGDMRGHSRLFCFFLALDLRCSSLEAAPCGDDLDSLRLHCIASPS